MDIAKFFVEKLHEDTQDLLKIPEMTLIDKPGRFGFNLYRKARGGSAIVRSSPIAICRSIGGERTYAKLLHGEEDIKELFGFGSQGRSSAFRETPESWQRSKLSSKLAMLTSN